MNNIWLKESTVLVTESCAAVHQHSSEPIGIVGLCDDKTITPPPQHLHFAILAAALSSISSIETKSISKRLSRANLLHVCTIHIVYRKKRGRRQMFCIDSNVCEIFTFTTGWLARLFPNVYKQFVYLTNALHTAYTLIIMHISAIEFFVYISL